MDLFLQPEIALSDRQKEALNFYTRSHYLIINNLLSQKFDELIDKWLPIVNDNDKGMMREALEQGKAKRFFTSEEWGNKIYNAYAKRTTQNLTKKDIIKHLKITVQDILEIDRAMVPTTTDLSVFRKIHLRDCLSEYCEGDKLEIPCFSSTTLDPDKYETQADFMLYKIKIPQGTPLIRIDLLDKTLANEYFGTSPQNEKEVLLPPMCFKILKMDTKTDKNLKGTVDLEALYPLNTAKILDDVLINLYKIKKIDLSNSILKHPPTQNRR